MYKKELSIEVLDSVESLPRVKFKVFTELVSQGVIKRTVKFKKSRTIFFNEDTKFFLYLNPYYKKLNVCGWFVEDSFKIEELDNALKNVFFNVDSDDYYEKLRTILSSYQKIDFKRDEFLNYSFSLDTSIDKEFHSGEPYLYFFSDFYDAINKFRSQEEIETIINRAKDLTK
jgi:hypothetical protein